MFQAIVKSHSDATAKRAKQAEDALAVRDKRGATFLGWPHARSFAGASSLCTLSGSRSTTARAGWGRESRPERPRGRRPLQRGGDKANPASLVGISGRQNTTRPLARFGRAPRGREDEIPDPNRRPLTDHLSRTSGAEPFC